MNNKFKKGSLALGTIATIAAPVAAVVSCGATANTINWDNKDTYAGVNASEFLNQIKHLGKAKQNAITVGKEQMMQLQYESESIRSIIAQLADFRYQNWQTDMENAQQGYEYEQVIKDQNVYTGSNDDTKQGFIDKLEALEKTIKANEDKFKKVEGFIKTLETLLGKLDVTGEYIADENKDTTAADKTPVADFYKNDYNSSDFPEVFKPLSAIREEKTAIIDDAYKNFYPEFTTRAAGDAEWPKELAANYGGAATFDQATDYLVSQEISSKAFNSYKFEINKSFTVEQKLWADNIDTKDSYKFLKTAVTSQEKETLEDIARIGTDKATIEDNILKIKRGDPIKATNASDPDSTIKSSVLSGSAIFLGSTSPDHRMTANAVSKLQEVVKYQHLLVKATQGKTPEETWTITADDLKKLMEYQQYQTPGTTDNQITQGFSLLSSPNLFNDYHRKQAKISEEDSNKFTDFVLGAISGNSAGTLKTQGSLGVKSEIEYLKEMVPGFSLGALTITKDGKATTPAINTINLDDLGKKLKDALDKEIAKIYSGYSPSATVAKDKIDEVNSEIEATITALGDDKVKTIFGKVFQDFFKNKNDLVYSLTTGTGTANTPTGNYLVISQFGIHIIKRTEYSDTKDIQEAIDADMANMAKDSSLTSSTSIVAELNAEFTDTKIMETLIGDKKTPIDNAYSKALGKKLDEYSKNKTDEVDKVSIADVREVIDSVNRLKEQTDVDGAIGDKLENWLVTQIDSGLRTLDPTITLTTIYQWAKSHGQGGTI